MLISFLNLISNQFVLSFNSLLVQLLPSLPQTFPSALRPGRRHIGSCQPPKVSFFCLSAKGLRSRARCYLTELSRASFLKESHSSFCFPLICGEFFVAAANFSSSTATNPDRVAYPMLKHLPPSGVDLFLHVFNLHGLHSFLSSWKSSSIICIQEMR